MDMDRGGPPPVPRRAASLKDVSGSPLLTHRSVSSHCFETQRQTAAVRSISLSSPRRELGRHEHADPKVPPLVPRRRRSYACTISSERQDAGFQPNDECELFPDHCYTYESRTLLIDLSSSCQFSLKDAKCIVEFFGEQSSTQVFVDGFRRIHSYGIKTKTPVWYKSEKLRVTVRTLRDEILAVGYFQVMENTRPFISIRLKMTSDWCNKTFMKNVIGHFVPVGLSDSSEDYEFCMCIPESHGTLTELFDRVIDFALTKGLPKEVSIPGIFLSVPDLHLKGVMEASSYAMGSLDVLLASVQRHSRYGYVTDQISDLLARVGRNQDASVSTQLKVQPVYSASTKVTTRSKLLSDDYSGVAISPKTTDSFSDVESSVGEDNDEQQYVHMAPVNTSTSLSQHLPHFQSTGECTSADPDDSAFGDGYVYFDPSKPSSYATVNPSLGPVNRRNSNPKRHPSKNEDGNAFQDGYNYTDSSKPSPYAAIARRPGPVNTTDANPKSYTSDDEEDNAVGDGYTYISIDPSKPSPYATTGPTCTVGLVDNRNPKRDDDVKCLDEDEPTEFDDGYVKVEPKLA